MASDPLNDSLAYGNLMKQAAERSCAAWRVNKAAISRYGTMEDKPDNKAPSMPRPGRRLIASRSHHRAALSRSVFTRAMERPSKRLVRAWEECRETHRPLACRDGSGGRCFR